MSAPDGPRRHGTGPALDPTALASRHPYFRHVNPYLGRLLSRLNLDKEFTRGEGCFLYDRQGERYLDFISQYGALPFGHNPPEIWRAIEAARTLDLPNFVQPSVLTAAGELAERLSRVAPPDLRYVTFANSGAEAIEVAIKLCRSATRRPGILATQNSFHGKTLGALSATGSRVYQDPFGAPAPGFEHIPFGDIDALERALTERPEYYAAFVLEPIQGEGGIVEPPAGYLGEARRLCDWTGTLLVIDEIQTGLGRTGKLFACEHDGVTPDVLTLAKALGGGLLPVGACLCTEKAYSESFALRHSSTFAGNTLACRAGLATLDLLERDNRALVRHVAGNGARLKRDLVDLQRTYPDVIKAVRGRGYMLGLQIDLDSPHDRHGLLGYLAEQHHLGYLITSYLLNVEKVRLCPAMSDGDVLRIEPPLIAGWEECAAFLAALERVLEIVAAGDTAGLLGHLIGARVAAPSPAARGAAPRRPAPRGVPRGAPRAAAADGRFGFLLHAIDPSDCAKVDQSLRAFGETQILDLKRRLGDFLGPLLVSEVLIESPTGRRAHGQFISLPYTAGEIVDLPYERALAEIASAVELSRARGAQITGLGGFTSILTRGGLALANVGRPPLTTGNSYTVAAAIKALHMASRRRNLELSTATAAIIGGAGAVGRATAILLSEEVSRLILVGNPRHPERSRRRLLDVAGSILRHLWELHTQEGREFGRASLGAHLASLGSKISGDPTEAEFVRLAQELDGRFGNLTIATGVDGILREADIVLTATSSVKSFVGAEHVKRDAIVCELSRPFNVPSDIRTTRPDVLFIDGGLVRIPGEPDLGFDFGQDRGIVLACMAETMLLALERSYRDTGLGACLDLGTIRELEALGEKHGFAVVC
ncbi:MAG: aminotransferase class III-fold pyridoxal phosphate-dependent enzyme [Candidatus Rokubacteria bacterium]|nr:aminotransferase class III-fold pyridoxal phosphate-dependent enzyme [Candidatus Rokubacteria bacterium]